MKTMISIDVTLWTNEAITPNGVFTLCTAKEDYFVYRHAVVRSLPYSLAKVRTWLAGIVCPHSFVGCVTKTYNVQVRGVWYPTEEHRIPLVFNENKIRCNLKDL